jgi:hypothetical protein
MRIGTNGARLLGRVEPGFRDLVKEAIEKGAVLRASTGKHPMRVVCPDGETLTLSQTPSDWRGRKNATAFFRRHGLEVGPKPQKPKPRAKPGVERAAAWLAMQPEDREFTQHDLAAELGVGPHQAYRLHLKEWVAKKKIVLVRYTRNPGQRGVGTAVYARRMPLTHNWNETLQVLTPDVKVDAVLDRIVEPLPTEPEVNGHAALQEAAEAPVATQKATMWRHISDALFSLAQAAEVAARLE